MITQENPVSDNPMTFAIDPGTALKAARALYAREWRNRNPGYDRALRPDRSTYSQQYRQTQGYIDAIEKYRRSEKHKVLEKARRNSPSASERIKRSARWKVKHALNTGVLVLPPACSRCGKDRDLQAHHHDYSRPLDVTFLCVRCHTKEHAA